MNSKQLHQLIPEHSEAALLQALAHENVRAAVQDLNASLRHLQRCAEDPVERKDWETTRDELLSEISRLTRKFTDAP